MKINKVLLTSCCIMLLSSFIMGCNGCQKNNEKQYGGYSKDGSTYTLATNEINSNVKINIPENVIVKEDNDEKNNAYISFYSVSKENYASKDDYILTYKIVEKDAIKEDKNSIEKLYSSLYTNLETSEIIQEKYGKYEYSYYTITYEQNEQKLTDYVFEIKIGKSHILAKMGTTCYPLQMEKNSILDTILKNIK